MLQLGFEMFHLAQKAMKQQACKQKNLRNQQGRKNENRTNRSSAGIEIVKFLRYHS